jgi:putative endonuclease
MYYVYIMASRRNGTLYVGVTNDIARRAHEHRSGKIDGFTKRYSVKQLVWYEPYDEIETAIAREKTIKRWPRKWKLNVIEAMNPSWADLYDDLNG